MIEGMTKEKYRYTCTSILRNLIVLFSNTYPHVYIYNIYVYVYINIRASRTTEEEDYEDKDSFFNCHI
jgi:hypothetical protein